MLNRENLHPYQEECVKHIVKNPYCGVFLEMGLGKTVSTLTALRQLIDGLEISRVLIVAPKRVAETVWEEETQRWSHLSSFRVSKVIGDPKARKKSLFKTDAELYIVSRDNIGWLAKTLVQEGKLNYFDTVVADELSSFKNRATERFKALNTLRPHIFRFIGLTGTPSPNSLMDLWPQIFLMDRGERLGKSITRYRNDYFLPAARSGMIVYSYSLRKGADQLIFNRINDICMSMKAVDYLQMPELIENFVEIPMPDELRKQYEKFERDMIMGLGTENEITAVNAAGLSNKLLQFANGAMYDDEKQVIPIHTLKLEALKEIIEDNPGKPVLVAWTYRFDRDRIMEYLSGYDIRELDGAEEINAWNRGEVPVMLAHPASAGHGLNLQAGGNIIVWFGQTWSLELYQQFNARLFRQGQKNGVVVHHLVLKGSHDEDVIAALKRKDKRQDALMESLKAKFDCYKNLFER